MSNLSFFIFLLFNLFLHSLNGAASEREGKLDPAGAGRSSPFIGVVHDPITGLYYYGDHSQHQLDPSVLEGRNNPEVIDEQFVLFKAHRSSIKKRPTRNPDEAARADIVLAQKGRVLEVRLDDGGILGFTTKVSGSKERRRAYSTPARLEKDSMRPILIQHPLRAQGHVHSRIEVDGSVSAARKELLLAEAYVIDAPHEKIINTQHSFYPKIVKLEMDLCDDDGDIIRTYLGSGVMVSVWHVLTAGHNLFFKQYATGPSVVRVYPGRSGDTIFHEAQAVSYVVHPGYVQISDETYKEYDIGLIVLDVPVGDATGFLPYDVFQKDDLEGALLRIIGYPALIHTATSTADKPDIVTLKGDDMYEMRGKGHRLTERQLFYFINTYGGHSGSPVLKILPNGQVVISAIHTYGAEVTAEGNCGTWISSEIKEYVDRWVEIFAGGQENGSDEDEGGTEISEDK